MIGIQFVVHNPHRTVQDQMVEYQGKPVRASMDVFEAELTAADGLCGTLKLRVADPELINEAQQFFTADKIVTLTATEYGVPLESGGTDQPAHQPA